MGCGATTPPNERTARPAARRRPRHGEPPVELGTRRPRVRRTASPRSVCAVSRRRRRHPTPAPRRRPCHSAVTFRGAGTIRHRGARVRRSRGRLRRRRAARFRRRGRQRKAGAAARSGCARRRAARFAGRSGQPRGACRPRARLGCARVRRAGGLRPPRSAPWQARRRTGVMFAALRRRFPMIANAGYASVSAGSAGLLLVLLIVAGHLLSASDYGRFSFALALTTIVETIMDIGLGHVTVRAVARDRASAGPLFRHVLGLKLVWVGIGLALLAIVAPILRSDPQVVWLCYLMGISSAVRSYLLTARGLLQGLDRFDVEAVIVVADRVLLLIVGTAALVAGYGLFGLAIAFVVSR